MDIHELQRFQTDLLTTVAEGGGVTGIAGVLAETTAAGVIVTNEFHKVLASTHKDYPGNSYLKYCYLEPSENSGLCQITLDDRICEAYQFPSYRKNELLGYLYILSEAGDIRLARDLGKTAALALAIQLVKEKEFALSEKRYIDAFLFDLLYGNMDSGKDIIARGKLWGWDLSRPQCVLVFELDDYDYFAGDKDALEILLDSVRAGMNELGEKSILTKRKREVISILFKSKDSVKAQNEYTKLVIEKISNQVRQRIPGRGLRLGVGRIYNNAKDIFRSYQEAKVALELGKLMDSRFSTPFFAKLGLSRILYNHDRQELAELYKETLGELERYDLVQKADLMKTLETYLAYRCDLRDTARVIFVHPNTLRYRLKQIQEILDVDLNDFDTKLNLMVAFKIKFIKAAEF